MGKIKPVDLYEQGITVAEYLSWAKAADGVTVTYDKSDNITTLKFYGPNVGDSPTFSVDGNPYNQKPGVDVDHPMDFASPGEDVNASLPDAQSKIAMITGFTFGVPDGNGHIIGSYIAENLKAFSAQEFLDILTTLPADESYHRFIGLFDGTTNAIGTKFADYIETGAGNDTVLGKAGNDVVNKWDSGDIDFSGGAGLDTLSFGATNGAYFPNPYTQTLVIDLKSGAGKNPYGGAIKVDSVEKVIGTDAADKIYGSEHDDWIETQDYGADLVKARGGDDTVVLWPFANGAHLDGGNGKDTLQTAFEIGQTTLDITDPTKNTGKFDNGVISSFEVFDFYSTSFDTSVSLTFRAGGGSEWVTISGQRSTELHLGGGNNRARGGSGSDVITSGNGKDRVEGAGGADVLTGGGNADLFIFKDGHGSDTVTDFDANGKDHDIIDLTGIIAIKNWTDLQKHHLHAQGGDVVIETSSDTMITLTQVKPRDLQAADFEFG